MFLWRDVKSNGYAVENLPNTGKYCMINVNEG